MPRYPQSVGGAGWRPGAFRARHLGWVLLVLAGHGLAFWLVANMANDAPLAAPPPLLLTLLAPSREPPAVPTPAPIRPSRPAIAPAATPSTARDDLPAATDIAPAPPSPAATASVPAEPIPAPTIVQPRFDATYLNNPRPAYPAFSKRLNEQGTVHLRVHVLANGLPDQVEIGRSSGFPRLDTAAREAVLQWRFVPARRGNEAVAEWVVVPLAFVLEK